MRQRPKFLGKVCFFLGAVLPAIAFAQLETPKNLTDFVGNFIYMLNYVIPFIAGFAFFAFLIGVLKYTGAGGDEERLGKARQLILYGLIGMLVIFSFWGLAALITKTYLGV